MKLKLVLVIATGFMLAACSVPENPKSSAPSTYASTGDEYSGLGINNPELTSRETVQGGGTKSVVDNSGQLSGIDLQIKNSYDQYLPNCYNSARAQAWKDFFNRGGTMANFVSTLQIVSSATTCSADGQENVTDPHFIRGYYDYYLPGCYTQSRHAAWQEFFGRGGTDNDFRITLQRTATTLPLPDCLR